MKTLPPSIWRSLLLPVVFGILLCHLPSAIAGELTAPEALKLLQQAAAAKASGDQRAAARIWIELLPWVRRNAPTGSAMLPQSLLQAGEVQASQGQFLQAEQTYQEALHLARELIEPRPRLVAIILNNLADLYVDLERFAEARLLMQESLTMKIAALGKDDLEVGVGYNNLGDLLREIGEIDLAEKNFATSIAVLKPLISQHPLAFAAALNNISGLQQRRGDFAQASHSLEQAQLLKLKALPTHHPDLALGWNNLGMLALGQGKFSAARDYLNRADALIRKVHGDNHYQSAIQMANLARLDWELGRQHLAIQKLKKAQRIFDAQLGLGHPDSLHNLSELLLAQHRSGSRSGLLGPLETLLRNRFALFTDQAWRLKPRERLLLLRRRDQSWYLADALATKDPLAAELALSLRLNTQGLLQEIQREQRLDASVPQASSSRRWIEPADVAAALPAGSVLIEFRRFLDPAHIPLRQSDPLPWRYQAYILNERGRLSVVALGSQAMLEPIIRQAYIASSEKLSDASGRWSDVSSVLLEPLRAAAGGATQWFIVPDAGLHQVPYQALEPERQIHLLSTGRDLLRLKQNTNQPVAGAPLVAGNPAIGIPLPATDKEVRGVAHLLGVKALEGTSFNSDLLKQLKHPLILHLATHGFWDTAKRGTSTRQTDPSPYQDPMLRSGIVVSPTTRTSDRFSAADFLPLDLARTELVTLSGCSTGLGDLHDSEGIYGLQRGVQVAGAKAMLSSLWPVDDEATSDWMVRYYGYLSKGLGRAEALSAVQADFRNHPKSLWRHLYYWAAWQLVGDWRPIPGL